MSRHHARVQETLGAWALDACPDDEATEIEVHFADCPPCRAEADELREVAGWLGVEEAHQPPVHLRQAVLARARGGAPTATAPLPVAAEPYAAEVDKLDALLGALGPQEWTTGVTRGWDVRDIVAHLGAADGLLAFRLGLGTAEAFGDGDRTELEPRTSEAIALHRSRPAEETRAAWRAQADALVARARTLDAAGLAQPVEFAGVRLSVADVLLDRAFETWVHADDVRLALGRPPVAPEPAHLELLASLAVRLLPVVLGLLGRQPVAQTARVVLEGPGGGSWTVALGPDVVRWEPEVTLRADMLEFCALVGGRRTPESISATVEGDPDLGQDLLRAAAALARP